MSMTVVIGGLCSTCLEYDSRVIFRRSIRRRAAAAAAMYALDHLFLAELGLWHATDACGVEIRFFRLDTP